MLQSEVVTYQMCNRLSLLIKPRFQYQLAPFHSFYLVLASRTIHVQLLETTREIITSFTVTFFSNFFLYRSTGAVASLYDISCLSQFPIFDDVQDMAYMLWKASPADGKPPMTTSFMGSHFFITSPSGTGISPVWDFRAGAAKGNPDAFVLAAKTADIPAPTGPQDVDWLQLKSVSGSLTTQVCYYSIMHCVHFKLMHYP